MKPDDIKGKVDFGILSIRDDEFEAVLKRFPPFTSVTGNRVYNLHRLALGDSTSYLVALVKCIEQGNTEALDAARDLLEELDPQWLLVVGIAGAIPSDEITLGDVVVSTRIHDFSVEAVLQDEMPEYAMMGGPIHKEAAKFVSNLPAFSGHLRGWNAPSSITTPRPAIEISDKNLYGDAKWQDKIKSSLMQHMNRTEPLVTSGAIGSSDKLIKDTQLLALRLLKAARQLRAVEMESAGVYRAAQGRNVPSLAIRGISDIIGLRRDPAWTRYACHTAAAFTYAFIRLRPIEPRSIEATSSSLKSGAGHNDVEIAKIKALAQLLSVLIATLGGVAIAYMGLKAVYVLAGALTLTQVLSTRKVSSVKGNSGFRFVATVAKQTATFLLASFVVATAASPLFPVTKGAGGSWSTGRASDVSSENSGDTAERNEDAEGDLELVTVIESNEEYCASPDNSAELPETVDDAGNLVQRSGMGRFGRLGASRRVKPPKVRMGSNQTTGRLPPEVINRIVDSSISPKLRLCYEDILARKTNISGTVRVRFVIGRDGQVSSVSNSGSDLPDERFVDCVVRSFYHMSFPSPEGGIVTVPYSIEFRRPARHAPNFSMRVDREGKVSVVKEDAGTNELPAAQHHLIVPTHPRGSLNGVVKPPRPIALPSSLPDKSEQ